MDTKGRVFVCLLLVLALSYPIYEAVDVVMSGGIGDHCTNDSHSPSGRGIGVFCRWGPSIGELLFGPLKAHLGYALLLGGSAIAFCVFAWWVTTAKSEKK